MHATSSIIYAPPTHALACSSGREDPVFGPNTRDCVGNTCELLKRSAAAAAGTGAAAFTKVIARHLEQLVKEETDGRSKPSEMRQDFIAVHRDTLLDTLGKSADPEARSAAAPFEATF